MDAQEIKRKFNKLKELKLVLTNEIQKNNQLKKEFINAGNEIKKLRDLQNSLNDKIGSQERLISKLHDDIVENI